MAKQPRIVLDSFALIGYLENESFSDRVEKVLNQARGSLLRVYLHVIHLGEVYYITSREQGRDSADLAYSRIRAFPLIFVENINEQLLLNAAELKANYPISYADSFAAAMAKITKCPLMTGDPEFKILENEGIIKVEWLA